MSRLTLLISNPYDYHYEVIESIIVKYPLLIRQTVDLIYLFFPYQKNLSFQRYISQKYPEIKFQKPESPSFTIHVTIYPKDLPNLNTRDIYISHQISQKLLEMKNVYYLAPWTQNFIQSNILPYTDINTLPYSDTNVSDDVKICTVVKPIYIIQGNITDSRRNYDLLTRLLNLETKYKYLIKIVGRGQKMSNFPESNKLVYRLNLNFEDYHKEFLNAYCLITLITASSHPQYYTDKITSSYNYIDGYKLKAIVDRPFAEKYKLSENKIYTFQKDEEIIQIFHQSLEDFYNK